VLTMDADFSHEPKEVPAMFAALERADMCVGSRYVGGVRVLNWQISRLLLSIFANIYVRTILGFRVTDCTSGFRAYRATLLKRVPLKRIESNGYSFLVEMLYRVLATGARVAEHPIVYVERREGQSKMSKSVILESVFMPWRLRLARMFGRL
jgi:dolichol-phosphate mannosyltransferase